MRKKYGHHLSYFNQQIPMSGRRSNKRLNKKVNRKKKTSPKKSIVTPPLPNQDIGQQIRYDDVQIPFSDLDLPEPVDLAKHHIEEDPLGDSPQTTNADGSRKRKREEDDYYSFQQDQDIAMGIGPDKKRKLNDDDSFLFDMFPMDDDQVGGGYTPITPLTPISDDVNPFLDDQTPHYFHNNNDDNMSPGMFQDDGMDLFGFDF